MQLLLVFASVAGAVVYLMKRFGPWSKPEKESCAGCAAGQKKGPAGAGPLKETK